MERPNRITKRNIGTQAVTAPVDLPLSSSDHRRVVAVLAYLDA